MNKKDIEISDLKYKLEKILEHLNKATAIAKTVEYATDGRVENSPPYVIGAIKARIQMATDVIEYGS